MTKNFVAGPNRFQLFKYLESRVQNGGINRRPGDLAKEAETALGFTVTPKNIVGACKDMGVEYIKNQPKPNGADTDNVSEVVHKLDRVVHTLDRIERKLNHIMAESNIDFIE